MGSASALNTRSSSGRRRLSILLSVFRIKLHQTGGTRRPNSAETVTSGHFHGCRSCSGRGVL